MYISSSIFLTTDLIVKQHQTEKKESKHRINNPEKKGRLKNWFFFKFTIHCSGQLADVDRFEEIANHH